MYRVIAGLGMFAITLYVHNVIYYNILASYHRDSRTFRPALLLGGPHNLTYNIIICFFYLFSRRVTFIINGINSRGAQGRPQSCRKQERETMTIIIKIINIIIIITWCHGKRPRIMILYKCIEL